jgi:TRAP-type C4-dicarboxylate transport system permease small subunit
MGETMDHSGPVNAHHAVTGQPPTGALDRLAKFFSDTAMLLACLAVVLMMIHVTAEAIGKYVFHVPMPATQETVQFYYMVALVFLPIAYIARGEGHICVELFTQNMKPRGRARLDVFVGILTLIWILLIAWYAGEEAVTTTLDGELQETGNGYLIVWPGRWFIPAGCAVMGMSVALQLLKDIRTVMWPGAATQP